MPGYAVQIKGIDELSPVFARINKAIASVGTTAKSVARESGLFQIGDALKTMRKEAVTLGDHLGRTFTPLEGLAGAGSVAGLTLLTQRFAEVGSQALRTSATIGVNTNALQTWGGAARLFGSSADEMSSAMGNLNNNIALAQKGLGSEFIVATRRYGLEGAKTAEELLVATARAFQNNPLLRGNPQKQSWLLAALGIPERLHFLLQRGEKDIQAYTREIERGILNPSQIRRAEDLALSFGLLEIRVGQLGNAVGDRLAPVLQPLIDKWSQWLIGVQESPAAMDAVGVGATALAGVLGVTMVSALGKLLWAANSVWASPLFRFLSTAAGGTLAGVLAGAYAFRPYETNKGEKEAIEKGLVAPSQAEARSAEARATPAAPDKKVSWWDILSIFAPGIAAGRAAWSGAPHFAQGGIVPAALHSGEMVLPASISQLLIRASTQATSSFGGERFGPSFGDAIRRDMPDLARNFVRDFIDALGQAWRSSPGDLAFALGGSGGAGFGASPAPAATGGFAGYKRRGRMDIAGAGAALSPGATYPGQKPVGDDESLRIGMKYFTGKGLSPEVAAGIVGRLAAESGGGRRINPNAVNPTSGAIGIAQWLGARKPAAVATGGDLVRQLDLVWQEFQGAEKKAFARIRNTKSPEDSARAMESFERAGNPQFTEGAARTARQIYNRYGGSGEGPVSVSALGRFSTGAVNFARLAPELVSSLGAAVNRLPEDIRAIGSGVPDLMRYDLGGDRGRFGSLAEQYGRQGAPGAYAPAVPTVASAGAASSGAAGGAGNGVGDNDTNHHVEVSFLNAPPGMKTGLRSASGPATVGVRVQRAMDAY